MLRLRRLIFSLSSLRTKQCRVSSPFVLLLLLPSVSIRRVFHQVALNNFGKSYSVLFCVMFLHYLVSSAIWVVPLQWSSFLPPYTHRLFDSSIFQVSCSPALKSSYFPLLLPRFSIIALLPHLPHSSISRLPLLNSPLLNPSIFPLYFPPFHALSPLKLLRLLLFPSFQLYHLFRLSPPRALVFGDQDLQDLVFHLVLSYFLTSTLLFYCSTLAPI